MAQANQAQKDWMSLKYGMFIHFGLTTFEGIDECGSGSFPAERFDPTELDIAGWAKLAKESGMNYAVLTAKHVDGFCLWPSRFTEYSVKNSPCQVDVVGEFVREFRKQGLKVGLYYALWDRNFPLYHEDATYAAYMRNQIQELLTQYGDLVELWFDGGWDKEHPTKEWMYDSAWETDPSSGLKHGEVWEWDTLYQMIHQLQPACLVANNTSSDRPGAVRYFPVDLRIAERCDYIYQEKVCEADSRQTWIKPDGQKVFLPLEYCNTLTPNWYYRHGQDVLHPSHFTIAGWYEKARQKNANLLLNVGPDRRGKIPEYHVYYLHKAAEKLGIAKNGLKG